jgi:nucleotide-binding universal stress UspA family protein
MMKLAAPETLPTRPVAESRAPRRSAAPSRIHEILCPTDLSPESDRAFDHARFLAEHFGARLSVCHVVELPSLEGAAGVAEEVWRRAENAARLHINRRVDELKVPHEVVLERGTSAHRTLVTHIDRTRPDLTVMATHGRDGLAHLFLGSVTEMVLQHACCPVLCVRATEHGSALSYRRLLVPTDLSQASRRAFPLAALLARQFDAEVLAVHVTQPPHPASLSGIPEIVETLPTEDDVRGFVAPDLDGVRLGLRLKSGSPWDRIIETARAETADLIVMSTHGRDSLTDRILGSHTERVVRHAPCPVLVV